MLPLVERNDGDYGFGAFVVNPSRRSYRAEIGHDAPELYEYTGEFVVRVGRWVATAPHVRRFHQASP
jgi:hypothetical protein